MVVAAQQGWGGGAVAKITDPTISDGFSTPSALSVAWQSEWRSQCAKNPVLRLRKRLGKGRGTDSPNSWFRKVGFLLPRSWWILIGEQWRRLAESGTLWPGEIILLGCN